MANPQAENGYTKIANELLEAMAGIRIPGEARQCLDVIFRKTYGYNKKTDQIALSQFSLITKLGKTHILRAIAKLAKINIIITKKGNRNGNTYQIQKDYSLWKPLPKKVILPKKVMRVTQKDNLSLPKKGHTKENYTKENITKEREGRFAPPSLQEVKDYISLKGYAIDAESWVAFYESKGWMVGKNKMKDWHAAILTWHKRSEVQNKIISLTNKF